MFQKKILILPLFFFAQSFSKYEKEVVSMPKATFEKMIDQATDKSSPQSDTQFVETLLKNKSYQTKYDEKAEEMIGKLESTILRSYIYKIASAVLGGIAGCASSDKIINEISNNTANADEKFKAKILFSFLGAEIFGAFLGTPLAFIDNYVTWNSVVSIARNYVEHTQIARDIIRIDNSKKYSFKEKLMAALVLFDGFKEIKKHESALASVK